MFATEVGKKVRKAGNDLYFAAVDKPGYLVFGPYEPLEAGCYAAKFEIQLDETHSQMKPSDWPIVCGRADVAINGGQIIASTSLYANRLTSVRPTYLPFQLIEAATVEYRVYTSGKVSLLADEPQVIPRDRHLHEVYEPVLDHDVVPQYPFVRENFGHFRFLHENGMDIGEDNKSAVGCFAGIYFRLENIEDTQVVNEVLFSNEYNVITDDCVFIDIGMNVGLTSLQAASHQSVHAVHSFEPFSVPRARAALNFELNPKFASKITVYPFGLSDIDAELSVSVSDTETIGTSIRGTTGSDDRTETIAIRDAATTLREILNRAKNSKLKVVTKIDCEGSEFAIIQSLERAQLLSHVNILMIEWHKWWSSNLDQNSLISVLSKSGFAVFDRTTPANIFAGMIYAVKTK